MKVLKTFFCPFEEKKYYVGDEYKGDRAKDLAHLLEKPKARKPRNQDKAKKVEIETK